MKLHPQVKHPDELLKVPSLNDRVATGLGSLLGSIWFFYFCVALDAAELPAVVQAHSAIAWVTYISQTVIQLLALPILQVYQNLLQAHNDAKADSDHLALTHIANQVDLLVDKHKN
jgi:hypothetical protein